MGLHVKNEGPAAERGVGRRGVELGLGRDGEEAAPGLGVEGSHCGGGPAPFGEVARGVHADACPLPVGRAHRRDGGPTLGWRQRRRDVLV